MVSGFLTKKIKSKKTLAERFRAAREKKEATLADAEEATKVRAKYLEALENSAWQTLPQDVYVRAFVLSYSKFLGLPQDEILDLFETELAINRRNSKSHALAYQNSVKDVKVLITPKFLAFFGLGVFVLSLFSYIAYQLVNFAGSPSLKLISPENNIVVESDSVDIRGVTENGIVLTVNEEGIPVTSDGTFSLNLKLHKGVNIVKVKAVNKTKKESSQILTIEYKPQTALNDATRTQQ